MITKAIVSQRYFVLRTGKILGYFYIIYDFRLFIHNSIVLDYIPEQRLRCLYNNLRVQNV